MMMKALGILREKQNSPNREDDDALILKSTMEHLGLLKVETAVITPEDFDREDLSAWDLIVPMCETYPRLMRLRQFERSSGTLVINPASSVLACYRVAMLKAFAQTPGLRVPPTELRRTTPQANARPPAFESAGGWWLKRGDVHNTCARDVAFARNWAEAEGIRADFQNREILDMAVQRHVDGDLIKFYGVGPGQWFTWFYHDPSSARRLPFELEELAGQAELAARAVGLEIFGGDAIIAPDGSIFLIDINSWPSFARVRTEAASQIARRLRARLREAAKKR